MTLLTAPPPPGFARELVTADKTLIESRCQQCGFVIVGGVLHGLQEAEAEHREKCPIAAHAADFGSSA